MLSLVQCDWIGTEVVFHLQVVLKLHGEYSRGPWGCLPTLCPGDLVLVLTRRDLDPGQAGFSASLVLFQVPQNWIGTEVLFHSQVVQILHGESSRGPWWCLPIQHPWWPGAGTNRKGLVNAIFLNTKVFFQVASIGGCIKMAHKNFLCFFSITVR